MTEQEALGVAVRAAERAGWDLHDYAAPLVRRNQECWEAIDLPKSTTIRTRPQVNVWVDDATGDANVSPLAWPKGLPVTEDEFMRQADRVASDAGWPLAGYEKGELFDHGDSWSVLYKGRSGRPGDYFDVHLIHGAAALSVRGGY